MKKNQLGLLIDKESEWNTYRQNSRVEYSSTENHNRLFINNES